MPPQAEWDRVASHLVSVDMPLGRVPARRAHPERRISSCRPDAATTAALYPGAYQSGAENPLAARPSTPRTRRLLRRLSRRRGRRPRPPRFVAYRRKSVRVQRDGYTVGTRVAPSAPSFWNRHAIANQSCTTYDWQRERVCSVASGSRARARTSAIVHGRKLDAPMTRSLIPMQASGAIRRR